MSWGNIAVGCRLSKQEPLFFKAWTGLVAGGLRPLDTLLEPAAGMPAHWAADSLARAFLQSDCDSILMIDDDMVFDPLDLERMRTNERGFGYDILFALCTTRTLPPKPVMMRLSKTQPGKYGGENYETVRTFQDGTVVPVDTAGLAFTLIRRSVFGAMMTVGSTIDENYFFTYGTGRETDDVPFMRSARKLGFKIGVDTAVKIDHIGHIPIGWQFLQVQRQ